MKKTTILAMVSIPASIAFANDFVQFISKQENKYEVGTPSEEIPPPVIPPDTGDLDLSIQAWKDVSMHDLANFKPIAKDGSSKGQASYKFNMGQEEFKGNPAGFKPYDENYDYSKIKNISYEDNGFYHAGNLKQVAYDHKHSSGKYYFEIEVSGQAHGDCLGLSSVITASDSRNDSVRVCYVGNLATGMKWDSKSVYTEYKTTGTQPTGTVYQVWIDYDNERMAIMETGSTLDEYLSDRYEEKVGSEDLSTQAWRNIGDTFDIGGLLPGLRDGSNSIVSKYKFNFGQEPFVGDSKGFTGYDLNYDSSLWNGCTIDAEGYCSPGNNSNAYYNKKKTTGKYYFEITAGDAGRPYVDAFGFFREDYFDYYHMIAASRAGYHDGGGYKYTDGSTGGTTPYHNGAIYDIGDVLQVWIDYDKKRIAIMQLGTDKSNYVNYHNIYHK